VGFGISTPEQAGAVAGMADGVVVGSAIVRQIEKDPGGLESLARSLAERMKK
jgi:tryptophan synthase alpha chain